MTKPVKIAGVVALTALAIAVATCFSAAPLVFFRTYVIPTAAMEDTIQRGDRIVARVYPKPTIERGEIVVAFGKKNREMVLKRLVGMAGDHIRIVKRQVYRNGEPLAEPYVKFITNFPEPALDDFPPDTPSSMYSEQGKYMLEHYVANGELVIPKGYCFLLGDNRENSFDDRLTGLTPEADIAGKALFIYAAGPGIDARRIFKPL